MRSVSGTSARAGLSPRRASISYADAFVLDPSTAEGSSELVTGRQLAVREWAFDRLGAARRKIIAGYELTVRLELGDGRMLLACHATPQLFDPIVFPSAPEDEFRAAFGGTGDDVVACGHIHLPYVRRIGDSLVLNPGSVGLGYDHAADQATLRFDGGRRGRWCRSAVDASPSS